MVLTTIDERGVILCFPLFLLINKHVYVHVCPVLYVVHLRSIHVLYLLR